MALNTGELGAFECQEDGGGDDAWDTLSASVCRDGEAMREMGGEEADRVLPFRLVDLVDGMRECEKFALSVWWSQRSSLLLADILEAARRPCR